MSSIAAGERGSRRRSAALASLAGLALTSAGVLLHAPSAEAAAKPQTAHQVQGKQLKAGQSARLSGDALFGFDSATLKPQARAQLRQLERALKLAVSVSCDGYADFGGNADHELALSSHRAAVVCAQLAHQIPGLATTAVGFGGTHPVVTAGTPAHRAANRRVVITVTKAAPAAPKAPRLDSIVAGNGRVTVTFTPRGVVAPGTRFEVSTDGGTHWRAVPARQHGPGTHRVVVTGLHNHHAYRIVLRARSGAGTGQHTRVHTVTPQPPVTHPAPTPPAPPTQPTPPTPTPPAPTQPAPTVPGAPQLGEAGSTYDADGTAAVVAWFGQPADVTGVTGYQYTLDGGETWASLPLVDDCTIGTDWCEALIPVDPDATYTLEIRAVTATTNGLPRESATVVVPSALPAAPTLDRANVDPATGAVTIGFTDNYGGAPVQNYQYSTDGGETWQDLGSYDWDFVNGDEVALNPFVLAPGSYSVLLRSVNGYGTGVSEALVVTVPVTGNTPGAVAYNAAGLVENGSGTGTDLYLTFGAPSDDGGSPITGYQYQALPYGAELDPNGWQDFPVTGSGPYTVQVPFDPNLGGSLFVRAVNAVGPSSAAVGTNMPPQV
jgi:outer membrane protein OmpA-like peptidoglycan-associated protein